MFQKKTVLVVGGGGYIGSHMVKVLIKNNYIPIVFDNFSTGHLDAVSKVTCIEGDLSNKDLLNHVFKQYDFDAVFHFASSIQVGESVADPQKYYLNNVCNTLTLLEVMLSNQVKKFIFSSTAAVYGEPKTIPLSVSHSKHPLNPYGKSKWMVEQILDDYDRAYGLRYASLRYFNAAGADPEGGLGERHDPETHLIPLVLRVASGESEVIRIFGDDYETKDGTCIRDYVHVMDLCDAHLLALECLEKKQQSITVNLGNGVGFSVKEVIEAAERVTGKKVSVLVGSRRAGDPAQLVADSVLAQTLLGWSPQYVSLDTIIQHAWNWESCKHLILKEG